MLLGIPRDNRTEDRCNSSHKDHMAKGHTETGSIMTGPMATDSRAIDRMAIDHIMTGLMATGNRATDRMAIDHIMTGLMATGNRVTDLQPVAGSEGHNSNITTRGHMAIDLRLAVADSGDHSNSSKEGLARRISVITEVREGLLLPISSCLSAGSR